MNVLTINEFVNENENIIENNDGFQYAVVLRGGSIGSRPIRDARDLIGKEVIDPDSLFNNKKSALEKAEKRNKYLTPGEKSYYNMKYIVVQVKDNVYTGK